MPVPEITSAEALDNYVVGKKTATGKKPAWQDVPYAVFALPPVAEAFAMPAVTEPFIVWITSGETESNCVSKRPDVSYVRRTRRC